LTGEELIVYLIETFKIKQIALTRGPEGSRLYTDDGKRIEQKAGSVPDDAVVDTVGAGDSYTAVLAYGNLHRIPPEETVRAATQLSEQICTIAGAIPPDNRFYKELNLKR
jgi:fructokinase